MKKVLLSLVAILAVVSFVPRAEAVMVQGYASADNRLWVWDYNGSGSWGSSSWYLLDTDNSWQTAHNFYGDAEAGKTIDLYFAVENIGTGGPLNPAGFLASLTSSVNFVQTGTGVFALGSGNSEIEAVNAWIGSPTVNPTGLSGGMIPLWYATNNGLISGTFPIADGNIVNGKSIWYDYNGGKIANIDDNAEWIWTGNNFASNMDNFAIVHTQFSFAPEVPEPATLSLLGMGLLSLLGLRKRA